MLASTPYIEASNMLQTSIRKIEEIYESLIAEYNVDPNKILELHEIFQESISQSLVMFAMGIGPEVAADDEDITDLLGDKDDSI